MKRLIFSIFIEIQDDELDNPADFNEDGTQRTTNKSKVVKSSFDQYRDQLIAAQASYAERIGVEYRCITDPFHYNQFATDFAICWPQISKYDVINFYKHYVMRMFAETYDQICYVDLDIVFNTHENIFDALPVDTHFCVPSSMVEAQWGIDIAPKDYNTCIRNPATKYWNTHAMLSGMTEDFSTSVYNTGIMVANAQNIRDLEYFVDFDNHISYMTHIKNDPDSMYPPNIKRVFNYDNETLFGFLVAVQMIPVYEIPPEWHMAIRGADYDPTAKVFHVIDKVFGRFFN